jgi:hypothetical protein
MRPFGRSRRTRVFNAPEKGESNATAPTSPRADEECDESSAAHVKGEDQGLFDRVDTLPRLKDGPGCHFSVPEPVSVRPLLEAPWMSRTSAARLGSAVKVQLRACPSDRRRKRATRSQGARRGMDRCRDGADAV